MGAEYREGRPAAVPMRKANEYLLVDDNAWAWDENLREEMEGIEMETRLNKDQVQEHAQ